MKIEMNWFTEIRWGAKSLVSLYISVLSGIVVAFQYDLGTPFFSTGSLDALIPFGQFWRALHFYSSQFFFILMLVHLAVVLLDRKLAEKATDEIVPDFSDDHNSNFLKIFAQISVGKWTLLTMTVPIGALILFTGYILRFDSTGESAGYIAENITRSIPFLGNWLDAFLFNISGSGLKVVYVNHVIGLGCLWGYLAWSHLRKYRVNVRDHGDILICMLLTSFLLDAPVEPSWPGDFHVLGPWFFIGLQELLRYIHPSLAGIVFPMIGLVFLLIAVNDQGRVSRWSMTGLIAWCVFYTVLTAAGWYR